MAKRGSRFTKDFMVLFLLKDTVSNRFRLLIDLYFFVEKYGIIIFIIEKLLPARNG